MFGWTIRTGLIASCVPARALPAAPTAKAWLRGLPPRQILRWISSHPRRQEDHQQGQAVGADQRADRDQRGVGQDHPGGVPANPVNSRRREPLRSAPTNRRARAAMTLRRAGRAATPAPPQALERWPGTAPPAALRPSRATLACWIDSKGGRDPVERDRKLAASRSPNRRQRSRNEAARTIVRTIRRRRSARAATSRPARTRMRTQPEPAADTRHGA